MKPGSNRIALFHAAIIIGVLVWTGILAGLYQWAVLAEQEHFDETIRLKAESLAQHTQALRSWIGGHGGVYAEVDRDIEPLPLLGHVKERDIVTPSGRRLTLLNSPAVLRLISEDFESDGGDTVKLVSSRPMNASNLPDAWEKQALLKLAAGAPKAQEFVSSNGESLFRLLYPMRHLPKCQKCHVYLADEPESIIGALSVTVDKSPYDRLTEQVVHKISVGYLSIWVVGLFGFLVFDITGARLLRQVEFAATHDGLTRLPNRAQVEKVLGEEYLRATRYASPLCVMMLDIDHFKNVNDSHGHQVGDRVLREVAAIIRDTLRTSDFVGRYGGEEFLVLTPQTDLQGAAQLAERIRMEIKTRPVILEDGESLLVTISVGVSTLSEAIKAPGELVKNADQSLYRAKETGRDRVCVTL